jgi:outer membrane protein TolC
MTVAMQRAADETPAAVADRARQRAAQARYERVRTETWPDLSIAGGATLGTGNVVSGGLFQPSGFASVAGPPAAVELAPGFQGMAGVTLSWDVLRLLVRIRETDAALVRRRAADVSLAAQRHARAMGAGLAWLDASRTAAATDVARTDVERAGQVLRVAEALAGAGVRPGVEHALAAAELALSEQRLARANGQADAAQARLAALLGDSSTAPRALGAPPVPPAAPSGREGHPNVRVMRTTVGEVDERVRVAQAAFLPRLELAAAGWVRAGNWPPGASIEVAPNWAVGVVVDVPLLDFASRAADLRAARADGDEARARLEVVELEVRGQLGEAQALLAAARRAEAQSSAVVAAVEAARNQALARFEAGLIDVTLVAASQTRLQEAELGALTARFDVLSTALARDYALGDLSDWMGAKP